jgi:L-lactate permease
MFMPLQVEVAHTLPLPLAWTAAVQNAAASYGTMASPARVALVSVTVGDTHIGGRLLGALVPYVVISAVVIGALFFVVLMP